MILSILITEYNKNRCPWMSYICVLHTLSDKMIKLYSLLAIFFVISAVSSEKARYDNYQLYKITPKTQKEVDQLVELWESEDFSFWNVPTTVDSPVDIMVPPHQRAQFGELLEQFNFENQLTINNIQEIIDEQERIHKAAPKAMEWNSYHNLREIYSWLDELAQKYQEVNVVVGGRTYEGRDIKGIEITFGKNLTNVFIEAGIHAREWISPAATTWMINEILNSPSNSIFRQFNYVYFPLFNPDGYAYSWERERLWRKTRAPYKAGSRTCYGADPNRNWDCHWNEVGASNNPCTETYAGPRAFSEIECKTLSEYITKRTKEGKKSDIYLSFHSYSQLLLFPWGYTAQPAPENNIWQRVGNAAASALKSVHGTPFRVGPIATTIYRVSGSSMEWVYDKHKSFFPFTYELRDKGQYGFLLPPKQIIPSGQEIIASVKTIFEEYKKIKK